MAEETSQWLVLLKTMGSLALVIALIYALAWLAKRYLHSTTSTVGSTMRVTQSLALDSKKRLAVVEIESRRLVVGISDQSVTYICDLDKTHGREETQHATA